MATNSFFRRLDILKILKVGISNKLDTKEILDKYNIRNNDKEPEELVNIRRDLNFLIDECNYPIDREPGKPEKWWLTKPVWLVAPSLDQNAALALKLAEKMLLPVLPKNTMGALDGLFTLATKELKGANQKLAAWLEKVRVIPQGLEMPAPYIDPDCENAVHKALFEQCKLKLKYLPDNSDLYSNLEEITASPLALVVRGNISYLVCRTENSETRHVLLHRLHDAEVLDGEEVLDSSFEVDDYIEQRNFDLPISDEEITLKLRIFDPSTAYLLLHEYDFGKESATGEDWERNMYVLNTKMKDTSELRRWLLGFGDKIEVIEPQYLRSEFARIGKRLERRHRELDSMFVRDSAGVVFSYLSPEDIVQRIFVNNLHLIFKNMDKDTQRAKSIRKYLEMRNAHKALEKEGKPPRSLFLRGLPGKNRDTAFQTAGKWTADVCGLNFVDLSDNPNHVLTKNDYAYASVNVSGKNSLVELDPFLTITINKLKDACGGCVVFEDFSVTSKELQTDLAAVFENRPVKGFTFSGNILLGATGLLEGSNIAGPQRIFSPAVSMMEVWE